MNKVLPKSLFAKIKNYPPHPIEMFNQIRARIKTRHIMMHLATVDKEFGVLNRSVMFRGIVDESAVCFVTERNMRKYQNLEDSPQISLILLVFLEDFKTSDNIVLPETWQVRLADATAVELEGEPLNKLWQEEPIFAKIRSHILECGRPTDPEELKELEARYLPMLENPQCADDEVLEQTESYTAFKVLAKRWEFYKYEPEKIHDRLQYDLLEDGKWEICNTDVCKDEKEKAGCQEE